MPDVPQIALPMQVVNGQIATVEQGSADDAVGQVLALVVTPPGWLGHSDNDEARGFGLADQAHAEVVDVELIESQIARFVPDADAVVDERREEFNDALSRVSVRIGAA
jgi:hypothetical protein